MSTFLGSTIWQPENVITIYFIFLDNYSSFFKIVNIHHKTNLLDKCYIKL